MGIGDIVVSYSRYLVADHSVPMYFEHSKLMTPKPKALPKYMNLLKPFSAFVWHCTYACLIGAVIITVVMAVLINNIGAYEYVNPVVAAMDTFGAQMGQRQLLLHFSLQSSSGHVNTNIFSCHVQTGVSLFGHLLWSLVHVCFHE